MLDITTHQLGGCLMRVSIFIEHLMNLFRNRHFQSELLGQVLGDQGGVYSLGYLGHGIDYLSQRASFGQFGTYIVVAA